MNFLGHSYLCEAYPQLITGNLAGDFYKGKLDNFKHLPRHILDGLRLHRFIDDVTDQSKSIVEAAHILQANGISRVAYIACDILVDHYLAKNWSNYSKSDYKEFISLIYHEVQLNLSFMEPDFKFLFERMQEYGWMLGYPTETGIGQTLSQFSRRIPFRNDLHKTMQVYQDQKDKLDSLFSEFLVEIKARSADFIRDQKLNNS